jgi:hypothetical protein
MSLTTASDDVDGSIAMNEGKVVSLSDLPSHVGGYE